MLNRKKHLVRQIEKMTDRQALPVLGFLYFSRARRYLTSPRGFFLIINIAQVALYAHSLTHRPGDLSLIISLISRLALVSLLANIPPIYAQLNKSILSMKLSK
jgi:hypothetical protein